MLTPADKLNRPHGNRIIQVLITRKCSEFWCSNCTQMLPFRKDALDMSLDVFEQAVKSLEGWPGIVAVFGGNPCSHSKFPEVCEILRRYVPPEQRGLWTNNLLQHGEVAAQTFIPEVSTFNLNCHTNTKAAEGFAKWLPGVKVWGFEHEARHHGALMLDYRDYGIPDEKWVELRENCDINQNWSAGIAERDGQAYAYFCEVAAAFDGVRGENNGVLAEPGWWKRPIADFEGQVKKCCDRGCGVPLRRKGHTDMDYVYDVSPGTIELTVGSKKIGVLMQETLPDGTHELTDYMGLRSKKR